MSESRARSSIFSRATTGMFLSPSCSEVTVMPLMALVAELATSMLVMPARLARSGSTFRLTWELSSSHSLRTRARFGGGAAECRSTCAAMCRNVRDVLRAAGGAHVGLAGDANLDRIVHRVGLQLAEVERAPGTVADRTGCTWSTKSGVMSLSFSSHQHLARS